MQRSSYSTLPHFLPARQDLGLESEGSHGNSHRPIPENQKQEIFQNLRNEKTIDVTDNFMSRSYGIFRVPESGLLLKSSGFFQALRISY